MTPVLEFDRVTWTVLPPYETGLQGVAFAVQPGELVAVRVQAAAGGLPVADAAQGLLEPEAGCVRIGGDDWRALAPDAAARRRGATGRVFSGRGWVSNLDVDENVVLAQRHHTARPLGAIREEAEAWARRFGLSGLPAARPAALGRAVLRRAEWVRAFLGTPTLIILEQPSRDLGAGELTPLVAAVAGARERGAGVLWIAEDESEWRVAAAQASRRYGRAGDALTPWEGEAK